jgi:hypothetical protein
MNPLSNPLNETGYGYQIESPTPATHTICHLLYMDNLKVYAAKTTESTDQNSGTFYNRHKTGIWPGQMSDA